MVFRNIEYLLAILVVLPAVAWLWHANFRAIQASRKAYGEPSLLDPKSRWTFRAEVGKLVGWCVVAAFVVVAAAGPMMPGRPEKIPTGTLQVVVVMDVSKSMAAEDYRSVMPDKDGSVTSVLGARGSRMDMAKYQIEAVMKAVQGNQVGLVTYTGEGFPQADLTNDTTALGFVLKKWVKVGKAPGGGSDYARGLKEALATFKRDEDPNKQKVIVLISDGGFTGDPQELYQTAEQVNKENVKLFIVGLGSHTAVPIPVYEGDRLTGYRKNKKGDVEMTKLEEENLRQLAAQTRGEYKHVPTDGMAKAVDLDWENSLGGFRTEIKNLDVYAYFVGAALLLLLVVSFVSRNRYKS